MIGEEWRDVTGYEGLYKVSSYGDVLGIKYNKLLSPFIERDGSRYVKLCKHSKKKQITVHNLVAKEFIENPNGLRWVIHLDNNKLNNHVDNLQYYNKNSPYQCESHPCTEYTEDSEGEVWKAVEDYPNIQVSNRGRVRNFIFRERGKLLHSFIWSNGYPNVHIKDANGTGKSIKVHRLVAKAFIPNPLNLPQVNHLDANKENNNVENLEWCDQFRNMKHIWDLHPEWSEARRGENAHNSILKEHEVLEIYDLAWSGAKRTKDIAKKYKVVPSLISVIKHGKAWDQITHHSLKNRKTGNIITSKLTDFQ